VARKHAPKVAGQAVYISSVTDPYLPAERSLELTRGILSELVPHLPRVLIQTRGPLAVRDIDLFRQFRAIRINMSIPTDSEEVRLAFEPKAPPLERRWEALAEIKAAGLSVGICVTPMLPLQQPEKFLDRVADFQPDVLVTQDFHNSQGCFGADTGAAARRILKTYRWSADEYRKWHEGARKRMQVFEGEAGFFPPPEKAAHFATA
jgi:DNA repair photolyase